MIYKYALCMTIAAFISILGNIYFITKGNASPIGTDIQAPPKVINKVQTIYRTQLVSSNIKHELTSSDCKELLESPLVISMDPFVLVEGTDGKLYLSESASGKASLGFLEWGVTVDFKPREVYRRNNLPIDLGVMWLGDLNVDVGPVFPIPFIPQVDFMMGLKEVNVCYVDILNKNVSWRVGVHQKYNQDMGLIFGVKVKLF